MLLAFQGSNPCPSGPLAKGSHRSGVLMTGGHLPARITPAKPFKGELDLDK